MSRFRLGGRTYQTGLTVARALRDPSIAALRRELAGDDAARLARFQQALARGLERGLDDLSGRYARELEAVLDRIALRRTEIVTAFDRVLAGETADVAAVRRAMDDLTEALRELRSPLDFIDSDRPPTTALPDAPRSRPRAADLDRALGPQRPHLDGLDAEVRVLVDRALDTDADAVRRAVGAETYQGFLRNVRALADSVDGGLDPVAAQRLADGLAQLNPETRRAHAAGRLPPVHDLSAPATGAPRPLGNRGVREHLAGAGDEVDDALRRFMTDEQPRSQPPTDVGIPSDTPPAVRTRIERSIRASAALRQLRETAPAQFAEYLAAYIAKGPEYVHQRTFAHYVWMRRSRHVRGALGEFDAAHQLPDSVALLKGPDHNVTARGTDLVGVDLDTGRLLVIDNKALARQVVSDVGALTRNLATNLGNDLARFRTLLSDPALPDAARVAIRRLERAVTELEQLERGLASGQRLTSAWGDVRRILDTAQIDLVVTGAFGQVTDVSPGLQALGIQFLPAAGTAAATTGGGP